MTTPPKYEDVVVQLEAVTSDLAKANEKIDQAWNLSSELDYQGFIPGALDAWKRPVKQHLPYDFSGNPGASATQYCNGWNDSGSYWSAHAKDLQQRLTVAEQRAECYMALLECVIDTGELTSEKHEKIESDICDEVKKFWLRDAELKPAAEPDHICEGCGSKGWTANCAQCVPY